MTLKRTVIAVAIGCLAALAAYIVFGISGLTFRVTGLEISQVNMDVRASWDDADSDKYTVSVLKDGKKIRKQTVSGESCVIKDLGDPGDYTVQVAAESKNKISRPDEEIINMKEMQDVRITGSEEDKFTANQFTLNVKANGKVTFKSEDPESVAVSENGTVTILKNGKSDILISVGATKNTCAVTKRVTVNAGQKYSGDMPELPNAIASQAIKCAWPYGTSRGTYKYGGGAPTGYFKETISRVYPDHSNWGIKQTRWGASCDVFVGTVVRGAGYDMNFPKGLNKDYSYLPNSSKFTKVSLSDLQPGDLIMYTFKGGGGHVCVYVEDEHGTGYIANAHYKLKTYGIIEKKNPKFNPGKYRTFGVYRASEECIAPLSEGEKGEAVEKTQRFLKWAGFFREKITGYYGKETAEAVNAFQEASGEKTDGKFGDESIKLAEEYTINTIEIEGEN